VSASIDDPATALQLAAVRGPCFSRTDRLPSGPSMMHAGSRSRWASCGRLSSLGRADCSSHGDAAAQERVSRQSPPVSIWEGRCDLDVIDQLTPWRHGRFGGTIRLAGGHAKRSVSEHHFACSRGGRVALVLYSV